MRIAVIDADLIGKKKHRFPNLASMKLSAYYKAQKNDVNLLKSYENLKSWNKIFI